jgi:hypothetical protein
MKSEKDFEGGYHDLFEVLILIFAWRDWVIILKWVLWK